MYLAVPVDDPLIALAEVEEMVRRRHEVAQGGSKPAVFNGFPIQTLPPSIRQCLESYKTL